MAPLRMGGRGYRKLRGLYAALKAAYRNAGGVRPLLNKAVAVWRSQGAEALLRRAFGLAPRASSGAEPLPGTAARARNARAASGSPLFGAATLPEPAPPTILFVSHEASRTGAPILLIEVAQLLKETLGLRCMFLLRTGGELERAFRAIGPTLVLGDPNRINAATLRELARQNIGLVYSNTATNGLVQRDLERLNRPILCHMHELGYSVERHFGAENLKAVLATTDLFLAGSGAVAHYLREVRRVPAERLAVAYPFVKLADTLARARARPRRSALRLPADGIVIGACGTIGWRKGTDLFLQLAQQTLRRGTVPMHFVWVGGPLTTAEFAQLHHDAVQMGIRDRLIFPGAVDDHIPYFARFDIFVLTSREDPFPLVALDAASLGIPVVCFDKAGGTPELVEADAGVIVPYMDIEGMTDAVIGLVGDDTRRRTLGEAAAAKVRARYDVDAAGRHIAEMVRARFVSETPGSLPRHGGSTA